MGVEGIPTRNEVLRTLREGDRVMSAAQRVAERYKDGARQLFSDVVSRKDSGT